MDARSSRYHEAYAHWQRDPLAFWGQELDKLTVLRRDCGRTAGFDGHVPLLSGRLGAGIANAAS